jgi:hypothetical protein
MWELITKVGDGDRLTINDVLDIKMKKYEFDKWITFIII